MEGLNDIDTFKRWRFGQITVTRVLEMPTLALDPCWFLHTTKEAVREQHWLSPTYANDDGDLFLNFQAFIIEAGGKRILVDPCNGNHKQRSVPMFSMLDNPFLERLASAGFPRESIDVVLCTHLHADHCGWNTMLVDGAWVPTFPNARYLFARGEFEHSKAEKGGDGEAVYEDSVEPILEAGLVELVDPEHVIVDGVRLEPTPGHTPGHCCVVISSEGQEALITGDMLHNPVQAALPHVSSLLCWDGEQAAATRRKVLGRVANSGTVLLGTHFPGPTGVYVTTHGDAWRVEEA